jgi:rhodanese-related sulfurtransferase
MIRMISLSLGLIVALSTLALADEPLKHTQDSLETVKQNVQSGKAVIVDVRELSEWNEGHLQDAVLIPRSKLVDEAQRAELTKKLDKNKIIYTHCRGGGRALSCGEILKKQGFDVRPLKAGTDELLKAGFPKATK